MRRRIQLLVLGLVASLLGLGILRAVTESSDRFTQLASLVTPAYIAVVVLFTIAIVRAGLPLNRVGFGDRLSRRHLLLALAAILTLRLIDFTLEPLIEALLGGPRDLERFSEVEGSIASLLSLLTLSWTVAAFGEEIAYRIVLLRGLCHAMGDTRAAQGVALVLQAVLFGLIHAYQGPTGVVSSAINGLVFGVVTLVGRWSIWPAALAHGINNTLGILALFRP